MARCTRPRAVDAYQPGMDQARRSGAGAHHARMPQPLIDALTVQWGLAPFLVGLELFLQGHKLGKRRIRVGVPAARLLVGTPGPRRTIVLAAVPVAITSRRTAFAVGSIAALRAIALFLAIGALGATLSALTTLLLLTTTAAMARTAVLFVARPGLR